MFRSGENLTNTVRGLRNGFGIHSRHHAAIENLAVLYVKRVKDLFILVMVDRLKISLQ